MSGHFNQLHHRTFDRLGPSGWYVPLVHPAPSKRRRQVSRWTAAWPAFVRRSSMNGLRSAPWPSLCVTVPEGQIPYRPGYHCVLTGRTSLVEPAAMLAYWNPWESIGGSEPSCFLRVVVSVSTCRRPPQKLLLRLIRSSTWIVRIGFHRHDLLASPLWTRQLGVLHT